MENLKLDLGLFESEDERGEKDYNVKKQEIKDIYNFQKKAKFFNSVDDISLVNALSSRRVEERKPVKDDTYISDDEIFCNLDDFSFNEKVNIKVFGIGGAGNNMVCHMMNNSPIENKSLYAFNTDLQVLKKIPQDINRIIIGQTVTKGNGSGSDPLVGKQAAEEDRNTFNKLLKNTDVLFLVSGMGKGTGTGASPVIAQIARELGVLVISIVNLPSYTTEGMNIYNKGINGYHELKNYVNGITTIDNEKIISESQISLQKSFEKANEIITKTINSMVDIIQVPAEINVDFNDIRTFFNEPIKFQLNEFKFSRDIDIKSQIANELDMTYLNHSLSGSTKSIANFKLNPNVENVFISEIRQVLEELTNNKNLEMTYSISFDSNIEFAELSLILEIVENEKYDDFHQFETFSEIKKEEIINQIDDNLSFDTLVEEKKEEFTFSQQNKNPVDETNDMNTQINFDFDDQFSKLKEEIAKKKENKTSESSINTKTIDFNDVQISSTKLNSFISKTLSLVRPNKTNKTKINN